MSKITTLSKFFYGTTVTFENNAIDFDEGGPEIQATMRVGNYSASEYVEEFQRAMRVAGTQAYVCTLNRATRQMTVSAPLNFTLRTFTGSRALVTAYEMAGFDTSINQTGSNSYTSSLGVGSEYRPQYPVDQYVDVEDNLIKEQGNVNFTPEGVVAQVSFGDIPRTIMNIRMITNVNLKNRPFYFNVAGIADARTFFSFLLTKGRVEWMRDVDTPANFVKAVLESSSDDRAGLRIQLKNMGTPDVYESGALTFRKVIA